MTKLNLEQLTNLFLLLSVERIGPTKLRGLLNKFKKIENILSANVRDIASVDGIGLNLAERIQRINFNREIVKNKTRFEIEKLKKLNGEITTIWDREYPSLLKKIYDPPLIIYTIGKFAEEDKNSISIVGTRNPTNYGKIQAERITQELAKQGITIVSGLARGIDSVAHRTALKTDGRTIAIIGSGLDVIYPPENRKLFYDISKHGVIVSEFSLGRKPDAQNFPRRNRIISGLSLGTVVIETGLPGGALQTASFALDQNREVFAVPGNLGTKQSEGTNKLIQKGEAKLVTNSEDILVELKLKIHPPVNKRSTKSKIELNLFEEKILDSLQTQQLHIDKIASQTKISTSDCLVHLLSLEFKGMVKQLPGKTFALL